MSKKEYTKEDMDNNFELGWKLGSASKMGKLGGQATLKKYGKDKMTEWGKKGGRPKKQTLE